MKYILTFIFAVMTSMAHGADLAAPEGPVVLTVSGNIANTNGEGVARFDQAMLDALEQRTTTTATPWYEDRQDFSGPLASAILDVVGAEGATMRLVALNDYSADVPVQDAADFPVIFATQLNGNIMSVRDKGPLFLVYPFDEFPDLFNEVYFGRSVWQITRIEILAE